MRLHEERSRKASAQALDCLENAKSQRGDHLCENAWYRKRHQSKTVRGHCNKAEILGRQHQRNYSELTAARHNKEDLCGGG